MPGMSLMTASFESCVVRSSELSVAGEGALVGVALLDGFRSLTAAEIARLRAVRVELTLNLRLCDRLGKVACVDGTPLTSLQKAVARRMMIFSFLPFEEVGFLDGGAVGVLDVRPGSG